MAVLNIGCKDEDKVSIKMQLNAVVSKLIHLQKKPLSAACYYGLYDTVELLLEKGAEVDDTCLRHAVEKGFRY